MKRLEKELAALKKREKAEENNLNELENDLDTLKMKVCERNVSLFMH